MNKRNAFYLLAGALLGGLGGYAYWHFIGCENGRCLLKSNMYYMTGYGTLLGAVVLNLFSTFKK